MCQPNEIKREIKKKTGRAKREAKQKSRGDMAHPGPPLRIATGHQIFTRGKMNNATETLSSTHLQLRTKLSLQKTSSSNYWNINIQQPSKRILHQLLKPDLQNTKRFYKWNRKQLQNLSPFCLNDRGASEKTWLHTTEDNDHSCYRILIRPLKTAQFTCIFVGNGSHVYKTLWAPPEFC